MAKDRLPHAEYVLRGAGRSQKNDQLLREGRQPNMLGVIHEGAPSFRR